MKLRCCLGMAALGAIATLAGPAEAETQLVVQSDGDCPSGQAVRQALWAIRPDNQWPALVANIHLVEERVRISLGQDEAHWREVPAPADCAERANRAAVVIAVWSAELPAQAIGAPRLSVVVRAPLPTPVTTAKKSTMVAEPGIAGFYGTIGGLAPGAAIELGWLRRDAGWGLRASLAYQSARSVRVDIGASNYVRTMLGAAVVLRWDRRRTFLSGDLGLLGAFTRAHGDGYSQNEAANGINLGPMVDGRAGLRLGSLRVWADASLCRWLAKETLRVDPLAAGPSTTSTLPSWDAHLGLGASLTFD
jgi:hypothetical protein